MISKAQFIETLERECAGLFIELDEEKIAHACTDWRKRYSGSALCLVSPENTTQIRNLAKACDRLGVAITTQGGNTGLVGGAVPCMNLEENKPHVILKTGRLRQTLQVDAKNLTLTASAGYTLREVQDAAKEAGFLFPLSLASEGSCTIGGNLASNAGGVAVLHYGNTRELCMGLEFVTAQGEIYSELRGLKKNNAGYNLSQLLIGSEGTLGIITQACLKIYPQPTCTVVVWLNVLNIHSAVNVLHALQSQFFNELGSFEWMNAQAIELVEKFFPARAPRPGTQVLQCEHVLAEFNGFCDESELREKVEACLSTLLEKSESGLLNGVVSQSLSENAILWSLRENISQAQSRAGLNVKHDVACAVSRIAEFHDDAVKKIVDLNVGARPVLFGHLGDGNLHFNVSGPEGEPHEFLVSHEQTLNEIVHASVLKVGGTVSAEHGIGQLKTELLKESVPPAQYTLFKAIKKALDPNNTLNPGKILVV